MACAGNSLVIYQTETDHRSKIEGADQCWPHAQSKASLVIVVYAQHVPGICHMRQFYRRVPLVEIWMHNLCKKKNPIDSFWV